MSDYAKAAHFLSYIRARRLAAFHRDHKRPQFAERQDRIVARYEAEYPDFPEAYERRKKDGDHRLP